jgi:hypothetical protein
VLLEEDLEAGRFVEEAYIVPFRKGIREMKAKEN